MKTPPPIKILRPGSFTDIHGTKVTFTAADLVEMAECYDPAADPAPLVAGHPKHDDPAQGWAGSLKVEDGVLLADPSQVAPEFAELVREGRFKRISPSFYPPKHPANPKPGKWYLKHIGFLGAMAPAIKGLGTVAFSEADDDASVTINLSEEQIMDPNANQDDKAVELAERETALDTREQDLKAREDALASDAAAAAHQSHVAFAEGLIDEGKLAPAGKAKIIGLMDQLGDTAEAVSFGEGDEAVQLTPIAAFKSLFEGAQPVIALGEHAPADTAVTGHKDSVKLAGEAVSFMESEQAAGRTITIQAAVRHVANVSKD
jgi:hypothetical protein